MNPWLVKAIAERKIAVDLEWAASYRLAVEADRARRETRQPAGPLSAGLLRTLASAVRLRGPVQPARLVGRALVIIDSALRALADAVVFPGMM